MGFVQHKQVAGGHKVDQRPGRGAFSALVNVAGIVFDASTGASLFHHFNVITSTLLEALGFQQAIVFSKVFKALFQFGFDIIERFFHAMLFGDIMFGRVDIDMIGFLQNLPGKWVESRDIFNLVTKKADPDRFAFAVSGQDFERITTHPEDTGLDFQVVALVLDIDQLPQEGIPTVDLSFWNLQHRGAIGFRVAQTINGGDRCHDNNILAGHQRRCCCQAQTVNLFVNIGFFLDIQIASWDVGFRLIIIVIRDEILHCIFREEFGILGVKLGCQCFVVGHHQGGQLQLLDHVGNCESLACASGTEQNLVMVAFVDTFHELTDGFRLVASGFVRSVEFEFHDVILH